MFGFAHKLGGAYATEQYIHGGAENVIVTLLTHEMVFGMMTYSGGGSYGKPVIHLGYSLQQNEKQSYLQGVLPKEHQWMDDKSR